MLYLIRHAWAEDRDATRWPDDDQRPLTDKGRKRFKKLLKKLTKGQFAPAIISTSPLVRCRETADLVAQSLENQPQIVELDALRPGSDLAALVAWTADRTEGDVAWVGHAPDVDRLAAQLVGDGQADIRFAKGAVAAIFFDAMITPGAGELQWLATAKLLGV
jgi:phosphohistidine phosphatase